jgi:hypothetical protein
MFRELLTLGIVFACAAPVAAQDGAAGVNAGAPSAVSASLDWLTTYDANVYRRDEQRVPDVYSTLSGALAVRHQFRRVGVTASGSADWMHFRRLITERGANGAGSLRLDFALNRVSPYVSASYTNSRRRRNLEIDTRPRIEESTIEGGALIRIGGKTELDLSARRSMHTYDAHAIADGVSLSQSLDQRADFVSVAVRQAVTPLTRFIVAADAGRDQFERSGARNADAVRLTGGFESEGRVDGRAVVGLHVLKPHDPGQREYRSLYLSLGTGVTLRDRLQMRVDAERSVAPSYRALTAYYERYSYGGLVTYAAGAALRVSASIGRRNTEYPVGDISAFSTVDRVRSNQETRYGSEISYRLGTLMLVNVSGEYTERRSVETALRFHGLSFRAGVRHVF